MDRNRFQERTTDKNKNYNHCYIYDDDGDEFIKNECAECDLCRYDDLFGEFTCSAKRLCEHG